jgi:arsenate reductase
MTDKPKVLFLCTGNCCRSQMAEALLRHLGGDRFEAYSAGSHPAGFVHPLATEAMAGMNMSTDGQNSKSWNDFATTPVDVVITLCDAAASETCPVWPGAPLTAHWSLPDPVGHFGSDEERTAFATAVAQRLRAKIEGLIKLDWSADPKELADRLRFLGEL